MFTFAFPWASLSWDSLIVEKVWWRNHRSVLLDYEMTLAENITEHSAIFSSSLSHFPSCWPFTKALVMPPPLAWCYNHWWHFEVYTLLFLFLLRSLNICYFPTVFGCFLLFSLLTLGSATQMEYKSGRFVMIRPRCWQWVVGEDIFKKYFAVIVLWSNEKISDRKNH